MSASLGSICPPEKESSNLAFKSSHTLFRSPRPLLSAEGAVMAPVVWIRRWILASEGWGIEYPQNSTSELVKFSYTNLLSKNNVSKRISKRVVLLPNTKRHRVVRVGWKLEKLDKAILFRSLIWHSQLKTAWPQPCPRLRTRWLRFLSSSKTKNAPGEDRTLGLGVTQHFRATNIAGTLHISTAL